jgi:hypothetical protein
MIARLLAAALALFAATLSARAQFADQATFAGAGGGSANAQTITLANALSLAALTGVKIVYIPSASNTAAATMTVNGFATTAMRKVTGAGLAALTGAEIISGQPYIVMYDGTFFDLLSPTSDIVGARSLGNSALGYNAPLNLELSATASGGAMTISVLTAAGGTPSSSTPVPIVYPGSTVGNGAPVVVQVQAALSFTISSGSTMGCVTTVQCRLWIVSLNNAGAATLCAIRAVTPTIIVALNEGTPQTSQSVTGGGSTAGLIYCNVSSVGATGMRILGYVEAEETSGSWGTPQVVRLFGPGVYKPGEIIQRVVSSTVSITTATGISNKVDLSGWSPSPQITPQSVANLVRAGLTGNYFAASVSDGYVQMFRGTDATVIGSISSGGGSTSPGSNMTNAVVCVAVDNPATTSPVTYGAFVSGTNNNFSWLGAVTTGGGTGYLILEEIQGALPEPANDDGLPQMVG